MKREVTTYLSIITLTVNSLNSPTKGHILTDWITKQDPIVCCLQETYVTGNGRHRTKVKGWEKIFQANRI
jgi:exonuclease III